MPLLDHFHPPLDRRNWESFHGGWGFQLAGQLNTRPLPYGFIAEGNVHIGIVVAADVAAFEEDADARTGAGPNGAVATQVWAPPQPPLLVPVDFASLETFEIRIYDQDRARTLVAAVELVSPGNKDRPEHRRAFLDKCAAYLREGVSVIVVDIVTSRRHNFHAALMELFNGGEAAVRAVTSDLYAVAYRVRPVGTRTQMEAWPTALALGEPLPTMPLWLTESLCVPLDLEAGYREACRYAAIG
ncbi:MAG TPA: DUF4058 family protein [Gemmataceae bacterium]|nr:DUF4058 family protein [Gemmataceae bacterium]